jgi:hypothetical protein
MAEDTGTAEGQNGAEAGEEQGGSDIGALVERMDQFSEQLGQLQGQQGEDPYGGDPYAAFAGEAFEDPYQAGQAPYVGEGFGQEPQGEQLVTLYDEAGQPHQVPASMFEQQQGPDPQRLAQELGIPEIQQQVERMQMMSTVSQYEQQYPELRDEAVYRPAAEKALQRAMMIAEGDQAEAYRLASNPHFVVDTWLAGRAGQGAGSETPAGSAGQEMPLEGASGTQGPGEQQRDPGDAMVSAVKSRQPPW